MLDSLTYSPEYKPEYSPIPNISLSQEIPVLNGLYIQTRLHTNKIKALDLIKYLIISSF